MYIRIPFKAPNCKLLKGPINNLFILNKNNFFIAILYYLKYLDTSPIHRIHFLEKQYVQ